MKTALIASLLMVTQVAFAADKVQLKFVEVLEAKPKYIEQPCDINICQGLPDLHQVGTTIVYHCNGDYYENWIPGKIHAGIFVQVANCSNLVVNHKREPVKKSAESY